MAAGQSNRTIGMTIGITGKCCSGKNEASAYLRQLGWQVIDVDRTGHKALQMEKETLAGLFGEGIIAPDGEVDRKALGDIVFGDRKKLKTLESVVHPRMRDIVRSESEKHTQSGRNVCINAALLFPMELHTLCEKVIKIDAPVCVRFQRARQRDGWTTLQILRRFAAQRRLFPKNLTRNVDMYTVRNSADRESLYAEIGEFLKSIERQG